MSSDTGQRKLTALLSADVAGYSRLMADDEADTIGTLTAYREEMAALIEERRGRVVDCTGDNLLAEFPTATDAVGCAVEIQSVLKARNASLMENRRMEFRIGIHVGEVRQEGERIYGDGVNIAARLEGLAEPGGICISGTVYDQVEGKLALRCEDLGEQSLKNISKPVRVYRIRLNSGEAVPEEALPGMDELTVPGFSGRPAIAVLPFDNLSGDPDQEHFADGIAEDLITRLSSWRWFPVIARNSSFVYRGKAVDVKQVSRELGVRYVVEGSVRKAGNRVRISAQLIDATSGHHVWATRYDREIREIFALQDEITEAIVGSMDPELRRYEMERVSRKDPQNLEAWELVERGLWHFYQLTKDDNAKARVLLERACELDPHLALAFSVLGWVHASDIIHQWTDSSTRSIAELDRAARRGVALDDKEPIGHLALSWASSFTGNEEQALAASELAVQLNPSFAAGYGWRGMFLTRAGRSDEAIASIEKAMRLSPQDQLMWMFLHTMALAQFGAGRYEDALKWAQLSLQRKPDSPLACRILAASYAQLGKIDEARRAAEEASRLTPEFSLSVASLIFASADPSLRDRIVDGLRKAGVKE